MSDPNADRNLLFGVLALQADLIDTGRFAEACSAWAATKSTPLADLMAGRGWITAEERAHVEFLLDRKLRRHDGDARASLAAVADDTARSVLARIDDPVVQQTMSQLGGPAGHVLVSTIAYTPGTRERYTLTRLHAKGGIGQVWLARDQSLGREVALKELRPEQAANPAVWSRFLDEARITGQLEHPGIVPVYELAPPSEGRQPFYTMRFVRGRTLSEAVRDYHARRAEGRADPLDLPGLLNTFVGVCQAVAYAHARGVIHRDLKPQNVVLGDFGEVMVLDWGLAKLVDRPEGDRSEAPAVSPGPGEHEPTIQGQALGTPAYMAPEQAEGRLDRVDRRSDVYGLGAILYEILAGRPPFGGDDTAEVLRRVIHEAPARPRQLNPTAPAALEAVCLRALAKRPEDRYAGASEVAEEVKRFLADEPVSAYRDPLSTRLTRWGRHHRTAAVSAGVLLVTAVVGLSVGTVLISRERAKAEANFRRARAAVDEYFTTVSENRLLDVPGLQPLRKELLDSARRYYGEFLRQHSDDPSVRVEAASASFRVGWISQMVGRPAEAVEPYRAATALYEELARAHPGDVEYRRFAATAHSARGMLLARLDRPADAMAEHRKALAIREALAKAEPANPLVQGDLARSHRHVGDLHRLVGKTEEALAEWARAVAIGRGALAGPLPRGSGRVDLTGRRDPSAILREDLAGVQCDRANLLRERGRHAEAQDAWIEARDLLEALTREQPRDQELRARLADAHLHGGRIQFDLSRYDEALQSYRRGQEIHQALAAANPAVTRYRHGQIEAQMQIGWTLRRLRRDTETLEAFRQAVDLAETLLAIEPGDADARNQLAQALALRADLVLKAGRAAEALPMARRALGIQEVLVRDRPETVFYRNVLATALRSVGRAEAAAGHPAEALAAFERACEIDRPLAETYPGNRYNLACGLALMISVAEPDRREALALQTVETLRRALATGYANVGSLRADPDLDALQQRLDFQALLAGMRGPAGAGE